MHQLLFVFAIFLGATLPLRADVIWLKNGRQIVAHVTRMDGTRVYYERGGSKASIALSEVDRARALGQRRHLGKDRRTQAVES